MSGISENMLNIILLVFLTSGLSIVYSNQVQNALNWWTVQTVVLSLLILAQGVSHKELEIIIVGLLLFGKTGIISILLRRVLKDSKTKWVGEIYLKRASSLVVAGGLTIVSYDITKPLMAFPQPGFRNGLAVAIALIFYGLLLMMIRKVAIVQVLGILLLDNGIFLAGFFLTQGMPLLVEMGSMFDVLVGIVIIGILSKQMLKNYNSLNVSHMRSLKG